MYSNKQKQGMGSSEPVAQKVEGDGSGTAQIQDKRSDTLAQMQLQEGIQQSPQIQQLKAAQKMASGQSANRPASDRNAVQREPVPTGSANVESPRLQAIRKLAGKAPTHDSIFDAFVKTLKGDGFKYTSSSKKSETDILGGLNEGACWPISDALGKAFSSILGKGLAKKSITGIYVPIDADYIDSSCTGNVKNNKAYCFGEHHYLDGYDPTSGKKGSLKYTQGEKLNFDAWKQELNPFLRLKNRGLLHKLKQKVISVWEFNGFYLLGFFEGKTMEYYKVGLSSNDMEFLSKSFAGEEAEAGKTADTQKT